MTDERIDEIIKHFDQLVEVLPFLKKSPTEQFTMMADCVAVRLQFDPELSLFHGVFMGLNGIANFYGANVEGLKKEGRNTLADFRQTCEICGVPVFRERRATRSKYTLAELLDGSDYTQPRSAEDDQWLNDSPRGRELI